MNHFSKVPHPYLGPTAWFTTFYKGPLFLVFRGSDALFYKILLLFPYELIFIIVFANEY